MGPLFVCRLYVEKYNHTFPSGHTANLRREVVVVVGGGGGTFRFGYEYEIENKYNFSNLVSML